MHEFVGGPGDWKNYKDKLAVVGFLFKVDEISHPFVERINPITFEPIESINFAELLGCSH